ncbi:MAG: hypothetical protein ABGX20_23330 [Bacillus sp. (in: firmicutes)]
MKFAEKEGWNITPLGQGGKKGIPFSEGGGISIRKIVNLQTNTFSGTQVVDIMGKVHIGKYHLEKMEYRNFLLSNGRRR